MFYAIDQWIGTGGWYSVIAGIGLILAVITQPEGAVGAALKAVDRLRSGNRRADQSIGGAGADAATAAATYPTPDLSDAPTILELENVVVRYGGGTAVDHVRMKVPQGAIVGVVGPNGAGKTTLMDAITGLAPYGGSVRLAGASLDGRRAHGRATAGLSRTFQGIDLDTDLSVRENIAVGVAGHLRAEEGRGDVERALDMLGLTEVADVAVDELSQGHRQLVSVARAVVGLPKVVLLDEPGAGLDSVESEWLGGILRRVRAAGITIVVIDHDMHLVFNLCDEVAVLDFGVMLAYGPPATIREDPAVVRAYLGSSLQLEPEAEAATGAHSDPGKQIR